MNLSTTLTHFFLFLYKNVNRLGILNIELIQTIFISIYFSYKKYLEDPYAKLIKTHPHFFSNGNILDIGANIGYTSYLFSRALTNPFKIFAFEPETRNTHILKNVAKKYHFLDKIVISATAVGDKEGKVELWHNTSHHADHRILTPELRKQLKNHIATQQTTLITIDYFLKKYPFSGPISFIKIDVQGYELAVCYGMEKTLLLNPDCIIGFEYCPSIMKTLGYSAEKLISFFQEKGYLFYRLNRRGVLIAINPNTDPLIKLGARYTGYFDIICIKKERCTKTA